MKGSIVLFWLLFILKIKAVYEEKRNENTEEGQYKTLIEKKKNLTNKEY